MANAASVQFGNCCARWRAPAARSRRNIGSCKTRRSAADNASASAGGTNSAACALTVSAAGDVGIGLTNPTDPLHVSGAVRATTFYGDGSNLTGVVGEPGPAGPEGPTGPAGDSLWQQSGDDAYYTEGALGLGTSAPATDLHLSAGDAAVRIQDSDADVGVGASSYIDFGQTEWGVFSRTGMIGDVASLRREMAITSEVGLNISFYPDGSNASMAVPAMTVTAADQVGIGVLTPSERLHVLGNVTADSYLNNSDRRLKTDIESIDDGLERVMELRSVRYLWDREAHPHREFEDRHQIGFIAQEVQEVLPEVVHTDAEGYHSVAYIQLIPLLVEAVQDQQDQLDEQAEIIERLAAALSASGN